MNPPPPSTSPADPTIHQRIASNPSVSVWVNASAGSGKTTILTNRVTRLLLDGVRPEKILCLTYTRAGAAEMSNRVTATLSKWATCDDATLDHDLDQLQNKAPLPKQRRTARCLFAKVLACPGGLRIRTIHSFCQEILSRFPIEAGLPPHFSLIDEQDLTVLCRETLDDLLREIGKNPHHELAQALETLIAAQGEHGFTHMLQEVIHARGQLAAAVEHAGGQDVLISRVRTFLDLKRSDTPASFRRSVMENLALSDLRQLAQWLAQGTQTHKDRSQILTSILETPLSERISRFNDYRALFLTNEGTPRKVFGSKDIMSQYPDIETLSAREATLLQHVLERIEAADIAQTTESVFVFGNAFTQKLASRKAARATLDYDDLIVLTENLLRRPGIAPWILYKLDNGIDHILVDEAQDTSRAQWHIVQCLTDEFFSGIGAQPYKNRTLFVVGDEKQSIFSFQNADPDSFLSLRTFFETKIRAAGQKLEKIGLHTSFRSAPAILKAVDQIFKDQSAREGVSPDPIAHMAARPADGRDKAGRVEVWPLLPSTSVDPASDGTWPMPTGYEDEHDPQAELSHQIAEKITSWLENKTILEGADRPIAPGDIMILLRRRGRFADLMVRALKTYKIPVTGVDRMRLVSQLPVMDVLAMIRFVLLPEDDLNLANLLRSPLLGITEEQLMALAIGRTGSLWHKLKTGPTFDAISHYLTTQLNAADYSTPFVFIAHILNTPCPSNPISGRQALWARLGDEALDPIDELLNEAQNFGRSHAPSLQNFLHWLTQSDTEIKRELDRGGGQVRIMTVHASKGLEAPIVFLPDTTSVPRSTDIPQFQWTSENIPLFLIRQPHYGPARAVWQKARDKQMEEYRRLLYVALTRAAHHLYICGWPHGKNETDISQSWYGLSSQALRALHQDHQVDDALSPRPAILLADMSSGSGRLLEPETAAFEAVSLPSWATRSVVAAPMGDIYASAPTDAPAATPDTAFIRGRIIHRLLQSLPDIPRDARRAATARFLSHPRHLLSAQQRGDIAGEVERLLDDQRFIHLFAADSLAEAPVTGSINGIPVFRQVDRLCRYENEIWIVDYKTNRPPPQSSDDIPASYRQQLSEYRLLLSALYPDQSIRCFLLWTYTPHLMEVLV